MADLQETLGHVIRQERRARQMTLRDLAERAAVSVVYLGEVERGQKYPSARVLEQFAAALDLAVPDLLQLVAGAMRPQAPVMLAPIGFTRPIAARPRREPTMIFGGFPASLPPLIVAADDDAQDWAEPLPLRLAR